ncbi:MAG: hypothetical protein GF346_12920 [Candidatus Eisenbacteria bacterium]|nr:hypothetical protein [Candidatus Eisenbacteria bacterium]
MGRKLLFCVLAVALTIPFLGALETVAAMRVAVEDGTGRGGGAATVDQLNNDTWFDFDATLVSAGDIDTEAELAEYDCVVIGGSGWNDADWTASMAAALRAFVESGGGLVATGWVNFEIRGDQGEDADLEYLVPGNNVPSVNEFQDGSIPIDILVAHPVTDGLSNFAHGASFNEVNRQGLEGDDTLLAAIEGAPGDHCVIVKEALVEGRTAFVGPIYLADTSQYNTAPLRSGDADRLLEQAVAWACGEGPVPTLNVSWGDIKSSYQDATNE